MPIKKKKKEKRQKLKGIRDKDIKLNLKRQSGIKIKRMKSKLYI